MRVFVIGATGFIGGTVANRLMSAGHVITGLARSADAAETLESQGIEPVAGNLTDHRSVEAAVQSAEATVWIAGGVDGAIEPSGVAAALPTDDACFLFTSGAAAYPDTGNEPVDESTPLASEATTNRENSVLGAPRGRNIVIRPTLVYGPGGDGGAGVRALIEPAREHGVSYYSSDVDCQLSTVHVHDLADLYLLAFQDAPSGTLINASAEPPLTGKRLAEAVAQAAGVPGKTEAIPSDQVIERLGPLGRLYTKNMVVSSERARTLLGWSPRGESLPEVLKGWS